MMGRVSSSKGPYLRGNIDNIPGLKHRILLAAQQQFDIDIRAAIDSFRFA